MTRTPKENVFHWLAALLLSVRVASPHSLSGASMCSPISVLKCSMELERAHIFAPRLRSRKQRARTS